MNNLRRTSPLMPCAPATAASTTLRSPRSLEAANYSAFSSVSAWGESAVGGFTSSAPSAGASSAGASLAAASSGGASAASGSATTGSSPASASAAASSATTSSAGVSSAAT